MLHFPRSLNPIIAMVNLDSNYDNAYANYEVEIKHKKCHWFFFIFGIDMFSFNFSQNWFFVPRRRNGKTHLYANSKKKVEQCIVALK